MDKTISKRWYFGEDGHGDFQNYWQLQVVQVDNVTGDYKLDFKYASYIVEYFHEMATLAMLPRK